MNAGTMRARSEAITMSQASANARPTPAAGPFSAARNALSVRTIVRTTPPNWRRIQRQAVVVPWRPSSIDSCAERISSRSPPAEKPGSRPVSTIERSSRAATSSASASWSCSVSGALRALRFAGSSMRTIARSPSRSTVTSSRSSVRAASTIAS